MLRKALSNKFTANIPYQRFDNECFIKLKPQETSQFSGYNAYLFTIEVEPKKLALETRIVFDGKNAHDPILSELILALHTPVNILFANTKEVDGMAVGQMVIELPENIEDILHVTEFMKERGIPFEEVHA